MIYELDVANSMVIYADLIAAKEKFDKAKGTDGEREAVDGFLLNYARFNDEVGCKLGHDVITYLKQMDPARYVSIAATEEQARKLLHPKTS